MIATLTVAACAGVASARRAAIVAATARAAPAEAGASTLPTFIMSLLLGACTSNWTRMGEPTPTSSDRFHLLSRRRPAAGSRARTAARGGRRAGVARIPEAIPDAHRAVWRDDDDHQEDEADHGVEASRRSRARLRATGIRCRDVVVDHDERERAEPGALDPAEAADHRDDEQLDRRTEADRRRARSDRSTRRRARRRARRRTPRTRTPASGGAATL